MLAIGRVVKDRFRVELPYIYIYIYNLKTKRACLCLSFDYRKCCNRSTATPSMPAGPPLTLGTLAQIFFPRRLHFRPKSPPRAGSTLKFPPTAKGSTKGVVGGVVSSLK